MANISLQVAQDPNTAASLSLADTLAKATFGDPEAQMKAKALASEVGVRMASRDKLLADTGLISAKTKSEQDAEDAILNAGPAIGAAGAAAVPLPVPVEASRPNDSTGYGPQPGIVSPHDLAVHDALVARERAIGPLLARGTPDQVAKGVNENYGGTILSAAAANPAIVSGDSLRIAGGLSTGSAPTTSTVWSAGDTSGVDAAAREKIAVENARPDVSKTVKGDDGQIYAIGKDATGKPTLSLLPGGPGPVQKAPEHFKDAAGNDIQWDPTTKAWIKAPGSSAAAPDAPKTMTDAQGNTRQWDPLKRTWELAPGTPNAPPKLETVGKDTVQRNPDGSLSAPDVTGRPPAEPTTPFGESKGDEGIAFNTVLTTANKAASGKVIGPDEARLYATAYNRLFGPRWDQKPDAQGVLRWVVAPGVPPPPGMVLPAPETFLGGQPPVAQPPVTQPPVTQPPVAQPPVAQPPVAQPPVAQPPVAGGQVFPNDAPKPTPASEAQNKAKQFLPSLQIATQTLDKFNKRNLPSTWELGYTMPSEELGTFGKYVEASPAISDNARRFGAAANQWTSASLYDLSGAAIGKGEFDRSVRGMLPRQTDPDDVVAEKTKLRHAFMDAVANTAYANDPKVLALLAQGKALNTDGSPPTQNGGGGPAPDDVPPKSYPGTPAGWKKMPPEKRKLFQ